MLTLWDSYWRWNSTSNYFTVRLLLFRYLFSLDLFLPQKQKNGKHGRECAKIWTDIMWGWWSERHSSASQLREMHRISHVCKHPLTSTGRAPGCLKVLLSPVRSGSPVPQRCHPPPGQSHQIRDSRPSLSPGPSLTENSLGLHFVTVARPRDQGQVQGQRLLGIVSKWGDKCKLI